MNASSFLILLVRPNPGMGNPGINQEYHVIPVFHLLLDDVSASEARVHLCSFRAIV